MTLTAVGELSVGATVPGVIGALLTASADLEAKIAALAQFSVTIAPPSLVADIELADQILASLKLNLALGIVPPSIDLQLKLMIDLALALKLQLQIIFDLFKLFAEAGVHVYTYSGTVDDLGGELTAALSSGLPGGAGGSELCNVLIMATTLGATWSAMTQVFRVEP